MDNKTSINGAWRLCAVASFISVFILVFFISHVRETADLWILKNIAISMSSTNYTNPFFAADIQFTQLSNSTNHEKQREQTECSIYDGKWVYDPEGSPLYKAEQCPFLSDQVSCRRNGRPDFEYEKWRWEGKECEIPRFNGKVMLERLRGKRVVIVGDSLNRNQWESLACLLYSALPPSRSYVNVLSGTYKVFKAKDYNCSVEFYWSPFLVQLQVNPNNGARILKLDNLSPMAEKWKGAHIMVFNTGHWWVHRGKFKAWDLFQYNGKTEEEMEMESAFALAMKTWAKWIEQKVDVKETTVLFRSISPEHKGNQWCFNETLPITDESYQEEFPRKMVRVVEKTMEAMKTPVIYLNVTKLSEYRRDAHPSVYATKVGKALFSMHQRKPESFADCSHWCLPGLPDTWNRLLYASMVLHSSEEISSS